MSYSEWMRNNRRNIGSRGSWLGFLAHLNPLKPFVSVLLSISGEMTSHSGPPSVAQRAILHDGRTVPLLFSQPTLPGQLFHRDRLLSDHRFDSGSGAYHRYFPVVLHSVIHYEKKILAEKFPEDFYQTKQRSRPSIPPSSFTAESPQHTSRTNRSSKTKDYNAVSRYPPVSTPS